jgi:hypothetical protein
MNELLSTNPALIESEIEEAKGEGTESESTYDKRIRMVPRALRDHMPDFYLVPLIKLFEREVAGDSMVVVKNEQESGNETDSSASVPSESGAQESTKPKAKSTRKKLGSFLRFKKGRKKINEVVAM